MLFADSMSHQPLPATGSLQHLGLVCCHLPVGNDCMRFPNDNMYTSTLCTRPSICRGVSDLSELAVMEKPICKRSLKVGIVRNAVLVTMPNVGIKSIYQGLGTVKNQTFKLTWSLCPPQFGHMNLQESLSLTSKRQESVVYQNASSRNLQGIIG